MFAIHKMISFLGADSSLNQRMSELVNEYASAYIELPSMISDLSLYGLYLTETQKAKLFGEVLPLTLESREANKARQAKAQIGINKLAFVLGNFKTFSIDELKSLLKVLVGQFHSFVGVDDKPEKGERKVVDE